MEDGWDAGGKQLVKGPAREVEDSWSQWKNSGAFKD